MHTRVQGPAFQPGPDGQKADREPAAPTPGVGPLPDVGVEREALDRARLSRDPRFDGRFFIAVRSTGIYCRPICPTPSPRMENVRYYRSAAEAREAGYRPCLRCRPETAPASPAWLGAAAVVKRALRLIEEGALDGAGVEELAERLGIGARHLRRLFMRHVGASPVSVAQTRRLHFAKRLLDETDLPITRIALESGYGSVRRFNAAFQEAYRKSPRELRRRGKRGNHFRLRLAYRPPYDWPAMLEFLAERAVPEIERVHGGRYTRTVVLDGQPALVSLQPAPRGDALLLEVRDAPAGALFELVTRARRCFDLGLEPGCIQAALGRDPRLAPLVRRSPGLRIPGVWDSFECAVRAVLSQGSPEAERRLLSRLVRCAGSRNGAVRTPDGSLSHLFPTGQALATAKLEGIGLAASQVAAVRALAEAFVERRLDFLAPAGELEAALAKLPGMDDKAVQYVLLRALGEPDAFPLTVAELQRAAALLAGPDRASFAAAVDDWRPWRGYATLHLWRLQGREDRPAIASTIPPMPMPTHPVCLLRRRTA